MKKLELTENQAEVLLRVLGDCINDGDNASQLCITDEDAEQIESVLSRLE